MARPQKQIDPKLVEGLARLGCTYEEIASIVECSTKLLQRRFVHLIKKGQDEMKLSIRRNQMRLSEKSAAMAIWLGKQYLGQRDQIDHRVEVTGIDAARQAYRDLLVDYKDVPPEIVAERVAKKFNVQPQDLTKEISEAVN